MRDYSFKRNWFQFAVLLLGILLFSLTPTSKVSAEEATAISIGRIDYDNLTMQIFNNNNGIVYYSTDQNTWIEVEGPYDTTTNSYSMDISWISGREEFTLYFRGNMVKTISSIVLPMQNTSIKVTYNSADDEFVFLDTDDAITMQWRKASDYTWNTVELDEDSFSYISFVNSMEILRVKGAKIYIRTPQVIGRNNNNVGCRPSKEVVLSITKRSNPPTIKVNVSKLNLNTTEAMEYYDMATKLWIDCNRTMLIEDIAPEALYANGSSNPTIMIRKAATSSASYSKTAYITINGQKAAPVIGDNSDDITYYYVNSKLVIQFHTASATNAYEYAIVKPGYSFEVGTASWRSVTSSKIMTISKTSAPDGCEIYVRKKGISQNTSRNIESVLSSAISYFTVKYPQM